MSWKKDMMDAVLRLERRMQALHAQIEINKLPPRNPKFLVPQNLLKKEVK